MAVEAGEDELVTAHAGIEPLGDPGNSAATETSRSDDCGIGCFEPEQPRYFKATRKLGDLCFGQKITQKSPCFVGGFKREQGSD